MDTVTLSLHRYQQLEALEKRANTLEADYLANLNEIRNSDKTVAFSDYGYHVHYYYFIPNEETLQKVKEYFSQISVCKPKWFEFWKKK